MTKLISKDFGWGIKKENATAYATACLELSDDITDFRKDSGYRKILEGGGLDVFNYFLNAIRQHDLPEMFFGNLEYFRENDKYGNPDLYSDSEIGKFSPTTLKYALNILNILEAFDKDKINKIVEIGGGYGGIAVILQKFIDFDEYVLVDLPECNLLTDKYISMFPSLKGKVKTVNCHELDYDFGNTDLTIAINSLSECNRDVQLGYFRDIISKSRYSYIVRNIDKQSCLDDHQQGLDLLPDNFLYDDTNRVEETYSSNRIVYIKREDD